MDMDTLKVIPHFHISEMDMVLEEEGRRKGYVPHTPECIYSRILRFCFITEM